MTYITELAVTEIPDAVGLLPWNVAYPDHYKENVTPGTTDMSDALQAALSYGPAALLGADYLVTKTSRVYARDGMSLSGVGRQNDSSVSSKFRTRIIRSGGGTYDVIDPYTDEVSGAGVPLSCRNVTLWGVTFATDATEPTDGAYIGGSDRIQNLSITYCSFDDGYEQLRLIAPLEAIIKHNNFGGGGRVSAAGDAVTFLPDNRATDGIERKPSDVHMSSNQLKEVGTAQFRSFLRLTAGDGIYLIDNHFQNSRQDLVRIDPTDGGVDITESMASVIFTANYFDSSNRYHVYFAGSKAKYRDMAFIGNQFRAAAGIGSIVVATSSVLSRVRIQDNVFRDNAYNAVRCTSTPEPVGWIITGNLFADNNTTDDAVYGDIRLPGDHFYSGNMFQGGGANGFAIHADGGSSVISNNDLSQSDATLQLVGTGNSKVFANSGFIQKSAGSVTITNPATSITVPHGLDEDPSTLGKVLLTRRSDGGGTTRGWVGTIDATNLTIHTNVTPTTTADFDWQLSTERF